VNDRSADVVIVGAGPAGSIAAYEMAGRGHSVLVLDKRQELGTPKRCAEGINIKGLQEVGLEPNPLWAVNKIVGSHIYAPSGKRVEMNDLGTTGFVLERKIFEKHLAKRAIDAGAKYMVKTLVTDVLKDGDRIVGVKARHMGEEFDVNAKLVIAADGVDSMTAKRAGINTLNKLSDYHSGFQYEMAGLRIQNDVLSLYFGVEVAPKGYVWIFPKGGGIANVGIGIVGVESGEGRRARDYLDKFIASHPEVFENASPIEVNAGGIPVKIDAETFVKDGFMVVGDAAQQVNPIHGGGIALAMRAAKLCAEVASSALTEDDVSRERLLEYETRWMEGDGKHLKRLLKLRYFLEKLDDKDFENFAVALRGEDIMALTRGDFKAIVNLALKSPRLLPVAKKFLV